MAWFYSGSSMKSLGELDRLVQDVLCAEDFSVDELLQFSATREARRVDEWEDVVNSEGPFRANDRWHEATVRCLSCLHGGRNSRIRSSRRLPSLTRRHYPYNVSEPLGPQRSALRLTYHLIPFKTVCSSSSPDSILFDHDCQRANRGERTG